MRSLLICHSLRLASWALLAALLVSCRTDTDLGRFDQTWEQPLEETSCVDWIDQMNVHQRFAAAADLLLSARGDSHGFPSDGQFTFFMSRITARCEAGDSQAALPAVASDVYSMYETQLSE